MGASVFKVRGKGASAKEAFDALVKEARHNYGHAGYTGTIAEKTKFVMISPPAGVTDPKALNSFADVLLDGDPRVDDKWGPAGCLPLAADEWLFFGWASE